MQSIQIHSIDFFLLILLTLILELEFLQVIRVPYIHGQGELHRDFHDPLILIKIAKERKTTYNIFLFKIYLVD